MRNSLLPVLLMTTGGYACGHGGGLKRRRLSQQSWDG